MVPAMNNNVKIVMATQLLSVIPPFILFLNINLTLGFERGPIKTWVLITKEEMQKVHFECHSSVNV